jgi:hypothetical protein
MSADAALGAGEWFFAISDGVCGVVMGSLSARRHSAFVVIDMVLKEER